MFLLIGFVWEKMLYTSLSQRYTDPQIPISQFDEMVSVGVVRNDDDIWVADHKSGHIIFEFNKFKEVDKGSFREYSQLLLEASGNEAKGEHSLSYRSK